MTEQTKRQFAPVSSRVRFPELEETILQAWRDEDTFREVDRVRAAAPLFVFLRGAADRRTAAPGSTTSFRGRSRT